MIGAGTAALEVLRSVTVESYVFVARLTMNGLRVIANWLVMSVAHARRSEAGRRADHYRPKPPAL